MRITSTHLRRITVWGAATIWGLFFTAIIVPSLTLLAQKKGLLDRSANSIWALAVSVIHALGTPWVGWAVSFVLGMTSGFAVGVWLDALLKRREAGETPSLSRTPAPSRAPLDRPSFSIKKVVFDPNGATEMYIDILFSNPGPATTIHNWKLLIYLPQHSPPIELTPRWHSAGRPLPPQQAWDPHFNDLSIRPLESGVGQLQSRIGFTINGVPAVQQIGAVGAKFRLSAEDVRGNILSDTYELREVLLG